MEKQQIILDGMWITTKEELWNMVRDKLPVPEYFGNNLDALADFMGESRDWEVIVTHQEMLEEHLGEYGKIFLELISE